MMQEEEILMRKRTFIMLMIITVLVSGCATKKNMEESTVTEAVAVQDVVEAVIPKAEDIVLPKISSINYLGKDIWNDGLITETKITHMASFMDDALYLSLNYYEGIPNTDSLSQQSSLVKFPNSSQKYLDEGSGLLIDTAFTMCNKILVEAEHTLLLAGSNSANGGMKVESYQMTTGETNWKLMEGTKTISEMDGVIYEEGTASDVIKCSDNNVVFISNIPDEAGLNKSYITKVTSEGTEIWKKELTTGIYAEQIVEGDSSDIFLILAKRINDSSKSIIKVENGLVVKTLELEFNADSIKKVGKNTFFILGTDHLDEVNSFTPMKFDTVSLITKIEDSLNILFTYSYETVNRLSDFVELGENTYLFVGNQSLSTVVTAFYDSGKTLVHLKSDTYPNMGQPSQIIKRELQGETEYVISGLNFEDNNGLLCTYSWIAHLYPLKPALDTLYKEILEKNSEAKFLERGNQERTDIAYAIAKYEGNDELMYIRYMKSNQKQCFAITGEWFNAQIINQYLLKNESGQWQVVEKFAVTDRISDKIKTQYPDVSATILPPFEVADYVVKVLDDQQLKAMLLLVDTSKLIGDISFCSYIGDYFYIMFKDGADYLIKYPEKETRTIFTINPWIPYNYYLIDDDKPPYFIFMQN